LDDFGVVGLIARIAWALAIFTSAAFVPVVLAQTKELNILAIESNPTPLVLAEKLKLEPVSAANALALGRVYENCLFFSGPASKTQWLKLFAPEVKADQPRTVTSRAYADVAYSRCEGLLKGTDVGAQHEQWMARAAKAGNLIAQLVMRQRETPTEQTIAAFETELRAALNSKNPDAIWEAARALWLAGFKWENLSKKPWGPALNGKDVDGLRAVFQAASCELGYPCGPGSWVMRSSCIRGSCVNSYQEWLATFLTPMQMQSLRAELPRVISALKKGRGAELIWP
jgi:hypothetical protein